MLCIGVSPLHVYATNSLSWTCAVSDVNNFVNKADGHVVVSPALAPAADRRKYSRDNHSRTLM